MAGKGGGAWKVAYADFVTAMMAFFLVMWITAQSKPVRESVAQYFENPTGTGPSDSIQAKEGNEGAKSHGAFQSGLGPSKGILTADDASTPGTKRSVYRPPKLIIYHPFPRTRSVGTLVIFEPDSAELSDDGVKILNALFPSLNGKSHKVEIRGYAVEGTMANGDQRETYRLSMDRCLAVKKVLVERGIEEMRIRLSQDGHHEPLTTRPEPEEQAKNSRVEVFLISEYAFEFKKHEEGTLMQQSESTEVEDDEKKHEKPAKGHH